MARPKNKTELLLLSNANFEKLVGMTDDLIAEERTTEFPEGYLNRNVKDVLAHVHEWHNMMQAWYTVGMAGDKPDMPKKGYTWKTMPDLNREIWKKYRDEKYDMIFSKLKESHNAIRELIDKHSDEELFTKKKYKWTGSTSMGAYLVSCTSSHYDWAFKLIKKCLKNKK